ncbi:hypothetical protein [Phyllobacterium sp. YR531]|uniref:hypothetical protein n=1 Tax=Phyllobacterium sp. YR531 TaxID=1144343 RepID=UPI00026F6CFC|nr:hypothetical protein [Phyllobacterium sp. YR531]EJN01625.1 hypothetical protein PMI41_03339 [Phyllobacterium sp. YR531]
MQSISRKYAVATAIAVLMLPAQAMAQGLKPPVETIVILRHGEKPEGGLGQLDCQGLNRSLALPAIIASKFGKPDRIFAPDPAEQKEDEGAFYNYIRPLATIEPTAIRFGLPVDTSFGLKDITGLQAALERPENRSATIVVAWEHKQARKLAKNLVRSHGGDPDTVPKWRGSDFDSLYVIRIDQQNPKNPAQFEHMAEGLDHLSQICPQQ